MGDHAVCVYTFKSKQLSYPLYSGVIANTYGKNVMLLF